jgi:hypothetical protein
MLALDRRRVRRTFEQRFTSARMAKDYLQVYRSLLRASKRRYREVPARRPAVLQSEMN